MAVDNALQHCIVNGGAVVDAVLLLPFLNSALTNEP